MVTRAFSIDRQRSPNGGVGYFKIIAAILERLAFAKILTHQGLDPQPAPSGRAREAGHDVAG